MSSQKDPGKITDLGSAIRAFRRRSGWTQADLARRLSVSQNTVSQYESGIAQPGRAVRVNLLAVADDALRSVLNNYLEEGDLPSSHGAIRVESPKDISLEDFHKAVELVALGRDAVREALSDLLCRGSHPQLPVVIALLIAQSRKPSFGSLLNGVRGVLEGEVANAGAEPPAADEFLGIMRRFRELAPPEEFAMFRRQAQNVIAIEERRRERERRKLNEGLAG